MASLGLSSVLIFCSPQDAYGFEHDLIVKELFNTSDREHVKIEFDSIELSIMQSDCMLTEGRKFIQSFLTEINSRYEISLTIPEACEFVRENLHSLELPAEMQESLYLVMGLLSVEEESVELNEYANFQTFELGKPNKKKWKKCSMGKKKQKTKYKLNSSPTSTSSDVELPGNMYAGAMEMFAGALLCIVPNPVTSRVGMAMILDGGRRVVDGHIQSKDEERLKRLESP